ncbi:MAG: biotin--[acetyl-CoA-carboxylase] ligase [Pikeienuella sp.]
MTYPPGAARRLVLERVDSTNAEAQRRAACGEPGPLWILAHQQTAGRGRQGRDWAQPPGNLAATLLMRPLLTAEQAAQLSFAACLAVADLLASLAPRARVTLKWPNDPLLNGRKVAGILLESASRQTRLDWLAIGIGVNLAAAPPLPQRPGAPVATSVVGEGGHLIAPEAALDRLAPRLEHWIARHATEGFGPLRSAWLGRAEGLGRRIVARLPGAEHAGIYEDVDAAGQLVLREQAGVLRISAAELYFPG